ncbi:MAG: DUF971 domain-containing protein [Verrucomicrobia subdivision 3 bacterium]|nr:DUF971 domain-containing protein [Limisphaerales bacterium]
MRKRVVFCLISGHRVSGWIEWRFEGEMQLMRPQDIQAIGNHLAIKWEDGSECFISLEQLRRHCPCAGCKGETDVMGNVYRAPAQTLTPKAYELVSLKQVGGYAIQPVWADGHSTGLYSFEYLRRVADAAST